MGRPIHTHNSIARSIRIAKLQNTEQQRDETQRRQFAMKLQEEATRKERQVQDSNKAESPEIHREPENKEKHNKRKKRSRRDLAQELNAEKQDTDEEQEHVDIIID